MPKPWQDALLGRQHDRSPGNVGCKGDGMAEALGRPSELSDMLGRQMAEALAVGSARETAWLKP